MVKGHFSIFLLLLGLVHGLDQEYKIQPDRCNKLDMACFVRDTCIKGGTNDKKLVQYVGDLDAKQKLDDTKKDCVFLQIKSFSTRKYLVMIEVESEEKEIKDSAAKLVLKKADGIALECKKGVADTTLAEIKFTLLGTPVNEAHHVFCSFIMEPEKPEVDKLITVMINLEDNPSVKFNDGADQEVAADQNYVQVWVQAKVGCNPDLVSSDATALSSNSSFTNVEEVDPSKIEIKCTAARSILRVVRASGEVLELTEPLKCQLKWKYKVGSEPEKEIPAGEALKMNCVTPVPACSKCSAFVHDDCADCNAPKAGEDDTTGCKTVVCESGMKWREDGILRTDREVECREAGDKIAWYWKKKSDEDNDEEATDTACSEKYDCFAYSKTLGITIKEDVTKGADGTLSCKNGEPIEIVVKEISTGNEVSSHQSLSCNAESGEYIGKDKEGEGEKKEGEGEKKEGEGEKKVPRNVNITCKAPEQSPEDPSTGNLALYVGISVAIVFVAILAIVGAVAFFLMKKKKQVKVAPRPKNLTREAVKAKTQDSSGGNPETPVAPAAAAAAGSNSKNESAESKSKQST